MNTFFFPANIYSLARILDSKPLLLVIWKITKIL